MVPFLARRRIFHTLGERNNPEPNFKTLPSCGVMIGDRLTVPARTAMPKTIQAVYENGVFHPLEQVSCLEQEHVLLTVEHPAEAEEQVFDRDFLAYCETQADDSASLEEVRQALATIPGSLADDIRAERNAC
jgi:predicted DNA-binding antitoxin AbrB/MazE fold protein